MFAGLSRVQTYYLTEAQKEDLTPEILSVIDAAAEGFTSPEVVEVLDTGTEGEGEDEEGEGEDGEDEDKGNDKLLNIIVAGPMRAELSGWTLKQSSGGAFHKRVWGSNLPQHWLICYQVWGRFDPQTIL